MSFRVDLDMFRGPLDLLLYLVRKHELEILDIPVGLITDQYLAHLEILEQLDVDSVGDFLEMASTLTEIKSRMVLPRADEIEEEFDDPRRELVRRLLEYKKYKDAASMMDERSRAWQERYPRLADDVPERKRNLAEEPLGEVELWDLVSAFGRVIRDHHEPQPSSIVYDDTPIHVYMSRIQARVRRDGRMSFSDLFQPAMHKSTLVGIFLAILELVRHHSLHAEQNDIFGEIWLLPGTESEAQLDPSAVDNYDHRAVDGESSETGEQALKNDESPPASADTKDAPPANDPT